MEYVLIFLYAFSLLLIFIFSLGQLHLTWYYLRSKKKQAKTTADVIINYPMVTIQLPIYNERYVIERLLQSVTAIEYPKDRLEIQILDDSTDDTTKTTANLAEELKLKGFNIHHIRRPNRVGYKAGALQYGLEICSGEFIAIFDADFMPQPDFLMKTIPSFSNENIGMVQTRWGHTNENYSLLTRLQAFGLDAHFSVEQTGRNFANSFINFNGTAGIWRKETIINAGGWSADTLTEDLDLSYRAQMKNWDFVYLENLVSPAELPVIMSAVKSQQYRWNKGAAETARKNLGKVLLSNASLTRKIHAVLHLLNSSVFIFVLLASLLSVPILYIKDYNPEFGTLFILGNIFLLGFFSISFYYWIANKAIRPNNKIYFFKLFPAFLTVSMGLSFHNTIAVLEGFLGFKTPFIRTPKFNVFSKNDSWKNNVYIKQKVNISTLSEAILSLYFIFGISSAYFLNDWGLFIFHLMLSIGFGFVFYNSVKPIKHA
ncbi:MAG: glycosyltransferase family 2 protein [Cyclobacteriaceae bacterium]|nr:glycosyltransferase family 2 protein [Cyclobacteriaceae bacterium]